MINIDPWPNIDNEYMNDSNDNKKEDTKDSLGNMIYVKLKPRWKWFRPPFWKIFRWAYVIDVAYMINDAYPAKVQNMFSVLPGDYDGDILPPEKCPNELNISFTCNPYKNPMIDNLADELRKRWLEDAEVPESITQ